MADPVLENIDLKASKLYAARMSYISRHFGPAAEKFSSSYYPEDTSPLIVEAAKAVLDNKEFIATEDAYIAKREEFQQMAGEMGIKYPQYDLKNLAVYPPAYYVEPKKTKKKPVAADPKAEDIADAIKLIMHGKPKPGDKKPEPVAVIKIDPADIAKIETMRKDMQELYYKRDGIIDGVAAAYNAQNTSAQQIDRFALARALNASREEFGERNIEHENKIDERKEKPPEYPKVYTLPLSHEFGQLNSNKNSGRI